ncbi:MFS transporter [Gordonia sp. ABSL11-1]|uniref:MFS transporter n=1 Tax=Gordonia sp. ABSL11-1 TaxID=3053924 RepID=UPI002573B361|nr:MFS transporter [Gordonia sp. ABSL11-1]MDL9949010.1 MFS transporter [Gordonia sp. ABSL11-1]
MTAETVSTTPARPIATGGARPRGHVRHGAGFWIVAGAYAILSAFGTAPTPLWPSYQQADGFGPLMVTIAFAIMVAGTVLSLALFGHLSDRLGRRRIIAPALFVSIAGAFVFVAWPQIPGLLIARFLTGFAIGLMAASATAYLADLDRHARPHVIAAQLPGLVAAGASLGGLAGGAAIAGVLAEWVPLSTRLELPYVAFGLLLLGALALVLVTPETVDIEALPEFRIRRVHIQPGRTGQFVGASMFGFAAFGATGLFSALGSLIIRGDLGLHDVFVGGLATFVVFAASAAAQLAAGRLAPRLLTGLGFGLYLVGFALTLLSIRNPSLGLFLGAAAVVGAGAGMLFKTGLSQAALSAVPASRAGVLSIFFIIAYLGMGIPSVLYGTIVGALGTLTSLGILVSALIVILIIGTFLAVPKRS